jgi:hypothetical protein
VEAPPVESRLATGLKIQRACIWAGLAMVPVFFVGLGLIAHFIPPPSPGMSTSAVARMYQQHHVRIRIGVSIAALAAPLLAMFFGVIGVQMRRIEGRYSPLAYVQMMLGACLVLVFIVPMLTWQAAAYRPFRAIETTQALNDLAWLPFVGIVSTFIFQAIAIAVAILTDSGRRPVFPRWAGYLNLWAVAGVLPGACVVFVKHGPLGWNGLLAWWLIISTFFVWMCVMAYVMFKAIAAQGAAQDAGGGLPDDRVDRLAAEVAQLRSELERVAGTRA